MGIKVIGCGCRAAGDDAVGLEVVQALSGRLPPSVRVSVAEMPGIGLIDLVADTDACVLVDCVLAGGAPGTLYHLEEADLPADGPAPLSAHGWGVAQALRLGRLVCPERLPSRIVILGIEPECVEPGAQGLSAPVRAALPALVDAVCAAVDRLLADASPPAPGGGAPLPEDPA